MGIHCRGRYPERLHHWLLQEHGLLLSVLCGGLLQQPARHNLAASGYVPRVQVPGPEEPSGDMLARGSCRAILFYKSGFDVEGPLSDPGSAGMRLRPLTLQGQAASYSDYALAGRLRDILPYGDTVNLIGSRDDV